MLDQDKIVEYLFLAIKYIIVTFMVFHLLAAIFAWRQVLSMHGQIKTSTGSLLILVNLLNVLFVFLALLVVIFVLSSKLS